MQGLIQRRGGLQVRPNTKSDECVCVCVRGGGGGGEGGRACCPLRAQYEKCTLRKCAGGTLYERGAGRGHAYVTYIKVIL